MPSSNPIDLISTINLLEPGQVPSEVKDSIPLLYSTALQMLCLVKPSTELQKFSDEVTEHINKYNEQTKQSTWEKEEPEDKDPKEQFAKVFETFKNTTEVTDELVQTVCESMIVPIQALFSEIFKDEPKGQQYTILSTNELIPLMKELIKKTNDREICSKYENGEKFCNEMENKKIINVFDMMQMVMCQNCCHSEDDHQVCSFFINKDYSCSTCGRSSSEHNICSHFEIDESENLDPYENKTKICIHCGMNYYSHEKKIKETSYPCQNYTNDGAKICKNCQFRDNDHLNSTTFNLLPPELRREIEFSYSLFSLPVSCSGDTDLIVTNLLLIQIFKIPNYMEVGRQMHGMS